MRYPRSSLCPGPPCDIQDPACDPGPPCDIQDPACDPGPPCDIQDPACDPGPPCDIQDPACDPGGCDPNDPACHPDHEICDNGGRDDDGDGFGDPVDSAVIGSTGPIEQDCRNRVDDDNDGKTDLSDSDCGSGFGAPHLDLSSLS